MKIVYGILCTLMASTFYCVAMQQEFIKKPKEKKVHERDNVEIKANIVVKTNKLLGDLCVFNQEVLAVQEMVMNDINDCCDGRNDKLVTSQQRGCDYKKDERIVQQLEKSHDVLRVELEKIKLLREDKQ